MLQYQTAIVQVKRKRDGIIGGIFRLIGIVVGMGLTVLGVAIMCTIVGIPIGFGLGMSGLLMMVNSAKNRQTIKCPNCGKKQAADKDVRRFSCKKCKENSYIEWL